MLGIIVNCLAILLGTLIGLLFKKFVNKDQANSLLKVLGVVVLITGVVGILKVILYLDENGNLQSTNELFLLIVVILGAIIGEIINLDKYITKFTTFIENKFSFGKFSEGFIDATMIFLVGAMSIVGSINAAFGDYQLLFLKSTLDFITAIVLATTLGVGVGLAFIPVFLFEGGIALITNITGNIISDTFLTHFNVIGYFLIICLGLNFLLNEKKKF